MEKLTTKISYRYTLVLQNGIDSQSGLPYKYYSRTRIPYSESDYRNYLEGYESFTPSKDQINLLLVSKKYVFIAEETNLFRANATYDEKEGVVKFSKNLADMTVKDFIFHILSPNPQWQMVEPGVLII